MKEVENKESKEKKKKDLEWSVYCFFKELMHSFGILIAVFVFFAPFIGAIVYLEENQIINPIDIGDKSKIENTMSLEFSDFTVTKVQIFKEYVYLATTPDGQQIVLKGVTPEVSDKNYVKLNKEFYKDGTSSEYRIDTFTVDFETAVEISKVNEECEVPITVNNRGGCSIIGYAW